ncbi:MAG TPA: TraR/DksA C4-type zinc finger protein [Verrucomicrobiae bacterium]|nr:TraR/DksA C4-type zinc finger protein [Verrucomicrobiae bacterium]
MKKQVKTAKSGKTKAISGKGTMGTVKTISKAKAATKLKAPPLEVKKKSVKAVAEPQPERPPKTLKLSKEDGTKFKKLLLDLRDHLIDGVSFLATDNLKRSQRDASGELSSYGLHMADAGTDSFDREFALSLVSNEQEALYEIEEALKRLEHNTYGICGNCEKPIMKARLEAVPFARLCVNCQSTIEKDRRRPVPQGPTFTEAADEEGGEAEEAEE